MGRLRDKITNSSQNSESVAPSDGGARRQLSSRRAFLKGFGTAALAGAVPLATGLVRIQVAGAASGSLPLNIDARPHEALRKRIEAAAMDNKVRVPPHNNNGDETRYENGRQLHQRLPAQSVWRGGSGSVRGLSSRGGERKIRRL
jgi:hypothetical protein